MLLCACVKVCGLDWRLSVHLSLGVIFVSFAYVSQGTIDDATIMSFLGHTTMVGLLPVPHPIVIRKYTPNRYTGLWFTAFMWGVVFLNNQTMPLFDGNVIKLFSVTVAPPLEY